MQSCKVCGGTAAGGCQHRNGAISYLLVQNELIKMLSPVTRHMHSSTLPLTALLCAGAAPDFAAFPGRKASVKHCKRCCSRLAACLCIPALLNPQAAPSRGNGIALMRSARAATRAPSIDSCARADVGCDRFHLTHYPTFSPAAPEGWRSPGASCMVLVLQQGVFQ